MLNENIASQKIDPYNSNHINEEDNIAVLTATVNYIHKCTHFDVRRY